MSLSMCICTLNRPESLDRALTSVRSGTTQPLEVIVSDDGRDEQTKAIAERHGARFINGPQRGLGANRNCALSAAAGTHVAFIDDDVEVSQRFVAHALAATERWPTDVVTGWELNHGHDPAGRVTPNNPSFLGFQSVPPVDDLRGIVINATVFPRQLFDKATFDEQVRYGYEELDMARQARAMGYRIRFADDLWVSHYPSPVNREMYARVQTASRLYLTWRAYKHYEERPMKALAFITTAALHHLAVSALRGNGIKRTVEPLSLAFGYAKASGRNRPGA